MDGMSRLVPAWLMVMKSEAAIRTMLHGPRGFVKTLLGKHENWQPVPRVLVCRFRLSEASGGRHARSQVYVTETLPDVSLCDLPVTKA